MKPGPAHANRKRCRSANPTRPAYPAAEPDRTRSCRVVAIPSPNPSVVRTRPLYAARVAQRPVHAFDDVAVPFAEVFRCRVPAVFVAVFAFRFFFFFFFFFFEPAEFFFLLVAIGFEFFFQVPD